MLNDALQWGRREECRIHPYLVEIAPSCETRVISHHQSLHASYGIPHQYLMVQYRYYEYVLHIEFYRSSRPRATPS